MIVSSKAEARNHARRMIRVERILRISQIIANSYFGVTTADIRRELAESGDRVCSRTVLRHLQIFIDLGYVYIDEVYVYGKKAKRYRSIKGLSKVLTGKESR